MPRRKQRNSANPKQMHGRFLASIAFVCSLPCAIVLTVCTLWQSGRQLSVKYVGAASEKNRMEPLATFLRLREHGTYLTESCLPFSSLFRCFNFVFKFRIPETRLKGAKISGKEGQKKNPSLLNLPSVCTSHFFLVKNS